MIITNVKRVRTSQPAQFAWGKLRKFQNVDEVASRLSGIHNVQKKYQSAVRKQAQQIRYCLIQAREYFTAAAAVSLATKPNLLYYGCMSLALAEILYKQSGDSSLDRARGQHRHHGLTMIVDRVSADRGLKEASSEIRAMPLETNGLRRGTFELWHQTSREHPLPGNITRHFESGGSTTGYETLWAPSDHSYPPIPLQGISLAECFTSLPLLSDTIEPQGLLSQLTRGTCESKLWMGPQWRREFVLILHPSFRNEAIINSITADPKDVDKIDVHQVADGYLINFHSDWINGSVHLPTPPAATINTQGWLMWANKPSLNEFGYYYVGLYLAGNYARYFPDKWLADVESSAPIALAIEELCATAEWRVPWLAACELDQTLYVNEA